MGKETVRYPDPLVTQIEELVANSDTFESKSEFHRFASDFLLTLLDPEHDPSVLGYKDICQSLEANHGQSLTPNDGRLADADTSFLHAYIQVRRHLLHGEVEAARTYVTDTFDQADREALLLDEVVGRYRQDAGESSPLLMTTEGDSAQTQQADAHTSDARTHDRADPEGQQDGQPAADGEDPTADETTRESDADPPASTSLEQSPETGQ